MKLGILLTNVASVDATWTTAHLVEAGLRAGHEVRLLEPVDHEITSAGRLVTRAWVVDDPDLDRDTLVGRLRAGELPRRYVDVSSLDRLLLRVNPLTPAALQVCLLAQEAGVAVINDPVGVTRTRSKAWLATLGDVPRPATLVTGSRASVYAFARQHRRRMLVVKPATGSGGRGVGLVPPGRGDMLDRALETARIRSGGHVVVQEYLSEARAGEKRLVWIDGEVIGAYLRMRSGGNFRHNLKQGARPERCAVTEEDRAICRAIGPHLVRNGIRIAGLDVIGGRLVEVNTLNPGGVHWADALGSDEPGRMAARAIELLTGPPPTLTSEACLA